MLKWEQSNTCLNCRVDLYPSVGAASPPLIYSAVAKASLPSKNSCFPLIVQSAARKRFIFPNLLGGSVGPYDWVLGNEMWQKWCPLFQMCTTKKRQWKDSILFPPRTHKTYRINLGDTYWRCRATKWKKSKSLDQALELSLPIRNYWRISPWWPNRSSSTHISTETLILTITHGWEFLNGKLGL